MSRQDLNGLWTGTVVYGKSYGQHSGKELHFSMDLVHHGDEIAGTAQDIGGLGVNPDPANILGTFRDKKIDFLKQYPTFHYGKDRSEKVTIDKSHTGPKIKYTGTLRDNGTLVGHWSMQMIFLFLWLIPVRLKKSGTWTMRRT